MRVLVTAGNTETPVDRVRCITNIFSGNTGTRIAWEAFHRRHSVCLLTSRPEVAKHLTQDRTPDESRWRVVPYRTFDDLHRLMAAEILSEEYDAIIHVAAVSDYQIAGTYSISQGTYFDSQSLTFECASRTPPLVNASAGKVKSNHDELWIRMKPTPKLVDKIRSPWGFRGVLVKFKLEVGVSDTQLMSIAEQSRRHSQADLIVANTLQDMQNWAMLKSSGSDFIKLDRPQLAETIIRFVENRHQQPSMDSAHMLVDFPNRNVGSSSNEIATTPLHSY